MNSLDSSRLMPLFKTYKWNEFWEVIKTAEYNPTIPIQSQNQLALKAMLLVAWWSDDISAREILKLYPPIITDSITYFAITYAYICLGDLKMINHYISKTPKNYPMWMKNYLEIEILGRSLKEKEQTALVKKLFIKNKILDDYIKIALLQSLENINANITYLKDFLEEIDLKDDNNHLCKLLYLRCGLRSVDEIDELTISSDLHPLLIERKAIYFAKQNDVVKSIQYFDMLANTKFLDLNSMNHWLELCLSLPQAKEYYIQRVDFAIRLVPDSLFIQGTAASYALSFSWLNGNYKLAYEIAIKYHKYRELPDTIFTKIPKIFFGYILHLCSHWQNNRNLYDNKLPNHKELYVFGESHSLSLSNINYSMGGFNFHSNSNYIAGIKMHHCGRNNMTHHAACLLEHFKCIKPNIDIMFTIGEIDTRPNEGIWQVHIKKEKNLEEIIDSTVGGYVEFLFENLKDKQLNSITIQGIPAPGYKLEDDKDPGDKEGFLSMVKKVNEKLKELTLAQGWNFLDVYAATVGEDGQSNKEWHIDGYHIQPLFYTQSDEWLIKPELAN